MKLVFKVEGEDLSFEKAYQNGVTFEWVKNEVAQKLTVTYADVTLEHEGRAVIDPFSIVDMGLTSGAELTVKIRDGADRGFEQLRKEMADEIDQSGAPAEEEQGS